MAYGVPVLDITLVAGADLTENQFYGVAISDTGLAVLPDHVDAERVVGILQNDPDEGEAASIRVYGVTKTVANSDTPGYGAELAVQANGRVDEAADEDLVMGIALLDATAADDIISMLITHSGVTSVAP